MDSGTVVLYADKQNTDRKYYFHSSRQQSQLWKNAFLLESINIRFPQKEGTLLKPASGPNSAPGYDAILSITTSWNRLFLKGWSQKWLVRIDPTSTNTKVTNHFYVRGHNFQMYLRSHFVDGKEYWRPISIEELAQLVGISRRQSRGYFKAM